MVLGNPGIGKTFFGYVLLLYLARMGATVVYESGLSQKRFLFSRDIVVQGSTRDFVTILDRPTTYYIVDGAKPAYYPARTILLTSPRRSVWFAFNKTNCEPLYMPVWSRKEIMKCRDLLYPNLDASMVSGHFRRWGGIARYVLEYAASDRQQLMLEKAFDSVDIDWLVDACGKLDANDAEVSHRLLHYRVNKRFDSEYFVFASLYVQQEGYKRLYEKDKRKLLEFIAASDGVGAIAVLRGHLFEGHVHSVLPRGGTFRIRHLIDDNEVHDDDEDLTEGEWEDDDETMDTADDCAMEEDTSDTTVTRNSQETVALPEKQTVIFSNDDDVVAADDNIYLRPAVKNYMSVDAIAKQMHYSR